MAKKDNTIFWIIGIVVAVIVMAQFVDIGDGVFAIAGGGAGSSVTQIIHGTDIGEAYNPWCIARPPVGETWLITGMVNDGASTYFQGCYILQSEVIPDWDYMVHLPEYGGISADNIPIDRVFIDHNAYLACKNCNILMISGVRV